MLTSDTRHLIATTREQRARELANVQRHEDDQAEARAWSDYTADLQAAVGWYRDTLHARAVAGFGTARQVAADRTAMECKVTVAGRRLVARLAEIGRAL